MAKHLLGDCPMRAKGVTSRRIMANAAKLKVPANKPADSHKPSQTKSPLKKRHWRLKPKDLDRLAKSQAA